MAEGAKPVTTLGVVAMKAKGERIVMLTCYDALFARLLDASGVDILLVGDSVNEVLAGQPSTLSATLDQMIYHTSMVRRGTQHALVVCDMPFLTYQVSTEEAIRNCGRVICRCCGTITEKSVFLIGFALRCKVRKRSVKM